MNATIKIIDQNEAEVEFSGTITVERGKAVEFKDKLSELFDEYAI